MIFRQSLRRDLNSVAGVMFATLFTILVTTSLIRFLNRATSDRIASSDILPLIAFNAIGFIPVLLVLTVFLSVLMVCGGLYLDWASKAPAKRPESFVHHEWISLHDYPEFRELVDFLRRELDRVGPSDAQRAREFFSRAVELEQLFFDESYTHPLP